MEETETIIHSVCPLYACRVCRTKSGWRHQQWCGIADVTEPDCADCRYYDPLRDKCAHPARERRRRGYEHNQHPLRA